MTSEEKVNVLREFLILYLKKVFKQNQYQGWYLAGSGYEFTPEINEDCFMLLSDSDEDYIPIKVPTTTDGVIDFIISMQEETAKRAYHNGQIKLRSALKDLLGLNLGDII